MRFVYAVLFSVVGAAAAMAAGNTQGITATTIKIGMIGPYSGVDSAFDPLDYGPAAYLRYVNSQGGVNGRKFDIVFADSACNETQGIAAAKKLIYQDKVFMIMGQPQAIHDFMPVRLRPVRIARRVLRLPQLEPLASAAARPAGSAPGGLSSTPSPPACAASTAPTRSL